MSHTLSRVISAEVDALARLASALGVGGNVVVKLLLLSSNLGAVVLAGLRLVDLQAQDLELELEDLVLDLAHRQGIRGIAAGGRDGIVETARLSLGVLSRHTGGLDDGQIIGVHVGEVILVDLRG